MIRLSHALFGLAVSFALLSVSAGHAASTSGQDTSMDSLRRLLKQVPLIDGHNDLPWRFRKDHTNFDAVDLSKDTSRLQPPLITDIPRLRAGGVGGQFWSVYVPPVPSGPPAVQALFEQIDIVHRMAARYPADLSLALSAADIERIHRENKIACLIGIEGGHSINDSLAVLRMSYALGARYMTLTHTKNTAWADAAGDVPAHHGLTAFGEQVIREMNRLGMLVDLSHVTDDTMRAALKASRAPVIFSHSSARGICRNARNVPDDVLQSVKATRGLVMVCFLPGYLTDENSAHLAAAMAESARLENAFPNDPARADQAMEAWRRAHPAPRVSLRNVADHIDYIRKIAGPDCVGIGSDFEGFHGQVEGLEDVSKYPDLLAELQRRGWSDDDLKKLAGLNLLRVFRDVEEVSRRLR